METPDGGIAGSRPRIAVTMPPPPAADANPATTGLVSELADAVLGAVAEAGGAAVPLWAGHRPSPDIDGLVLVGGGDVHPSAYSTEDPHPANYAMDPRQDAFEIDLVRAALAEGVPVLAICRGMQVLTVALGGTLTQHLEDSAGRHRGHPPAALMVRHQVDIDPGARLAAMLGRTRAGVASGHHQAVDRVPSDLAVVATGPDGIVEAVEHTDRWAIGVQWHPEHGLGDPPDRIALFAGLVAAARDRHAVGR